MFEQNNFPTELIKLLKTYECRKSQTSFIVWCPDHVSDFSEPVNERVHHKQQNKHSITQVVNRLPRTEEMYKHQAQSTGFIWEGKGTTSVFSKHEQTTENTILSGDRNLPQTKGHLKDVSEQQSKVEDRIYFPDEIEERASGRRGRSHVLEKLASDCGRPFYRNSETSIANNTAGLGEFPWMTMLAYDVGGFIVPNCAGTLISSRHVLTAASCVQQGNELNLGQL